MSSKAFRKFRNFSTNWISAHVTTSFQECLQHYETALDYCKRELQNDEAYLSAITVTITYNLARLYEALHEFGKVICCYVLYSGYEYSAGSDPVIIPKTFHISFSRIFHLLLEKLYTPLSII